MKPVFLIYFLPFLTIISTSARHFEAFQQDSLPNTLGQYNAITTAVPFLSISPDARQAGLGDAGVATSPDANSAYWNPGKLTFINQKFGGAISYTPWLGKIINDMSISYLTGFYKITDEQTVGLSIKYFDLGEITFTADNSQVLGVYNPREMSIDATYSRKLSSEFAVGITGRYIYSNLTGAFSGSDAKPAHGAAADIGIFYTKLLQKSARESTLSFGAVISNIGPKLTYTDEENEQFIPTNLRIGSAFTTNLDPFNSLTFTLDFNKLMVPTPPQEEGQSLISGMFGSFSDAPGGASEEFKEFMISGGIEYWYNETFAARLGYFNEDKTKGNRKYMTIGLGFRKNRFGIDAAYLVPTNKREHPLAETIRFTLLLQFINNNEEESVTD